MATENSWGAPRIHGELLCLGFEVSERSVSRYLRNLPGAFQVLFIIRHGLGDGDTAVDAGGADADQPPEPMAERSG
jgi:hypothetical protein